MSSSTIDESKIIIRPIELGDLDEIVRVAELGFGIPDVAYKKHHYENHIKTFPEGQVCILYDGNFVGSCSSAILNYEEYRDDHTFDEVSIDGNIDKNHTYDGTTLYGLDVVVHPDYRKLRIGGRLYEQRRKICRQFNLKNIIIGGRMPNYHKYANKYTAEEYVKLVEQGEIFDPVLVFQMNHGFKVRSVNAKYLKGDAESLEYAAIMEWKNDQYKPK